MLNRSQRSIIDAEIRKLLVIANEVDDKTDQLLAETALKAIQLINAGTDIRTAVIKAIKDLNLSTELTAITYDGMVRACTLGFEDIPPNPDGLRQAWAEDFLTFERRYMTMVQTMETSAWGGAVAALSLGTSVRELTEKLIDATPAELPQYMNKMLRFHKYMRPVPTEVERLYKQIERLSRNGAPTDELKVAYRKLARAIERGTPEQIENAVINAIYEKGRYNARRIARTELARAYVEGEYGKYVEDDDVVAVRWKLSDRHPVTDICDLYANADLFGMGKGIYPKDNVPYFPAHPHCMCHLLPVYAGEVPKAKRRIARGIREYLDQASEIHRRHILGVNGAYEYEKTGKQYILIPFEQPKPRFL